MPFILKMILVSALIPLFLFVIFINPNSRIVIDDGLVTYSYLWKSGRIWHLMYGSIVLLYVSHLLLRRHKHSRSLCLLTWGTFWLWDGIIDGSPWKDLIGVLLVGTGVFWFYLYKRKPVVEYFSKAV
jgi:hypothetical protein